MREGLHNVYCERLPHFTFSEVTEATRLSGQGLAPSLYHALRLL